MVNWLEESLLTLLISQSKDLEAVSTIEDELGFLRAQGENEFFIKKLVHLLKPF